MADPVDTALVALFAEVSSTETDTSFDNIKRAKKLGKQAEAAVDAAHAEYVKSLETMHSELECFLEDEEQKVVTLTKRARTALRGEISRMNG